METTISLEPALFARVDAFAEAHNEPREVVLAHAIEAYLCQREQSDLANDVPSEEEERRTLQFMRRAGQCALKAGDCTWWPTSPPGQ